MANYAFTPADITADEGGTIKSGTAGASITAGLAVYVNTADARKIHPAGNDTAAKAVCAGIALNAATAGQPVFFLEKGTLNVTASIVAVGAVVVLSDAGALSPAADVAAADWVMVVGVGLAANKMLVNCSPNRLVANAVVPG